jgi:serine O-acetyltransferase
MRRRVAAGAGVSLRSGIAGDIRMRSTVSGSKLTLGAILKCWIEVGFWATFLYRLSRPLRKGPVRALGRIIYSFNIVTTGADLDPDFAIGPGLYLPHPVGVVIAGQLGSNIIVMSGAVIGGSGSENHPEGFPTIEDACVIFAGAKVFGNIRLGRGTRVGANSVLLRSTPPGALVVGIPGRIAARKSTVEAV